MKIVRVIVFFLIVFPLAYVLAEKFQRKGGRASMVEHFFATDDEYDVLAFGPSYVFCTLCPFELYRGYGLRAFDICTPDQPIDVTYHYIKRALKSFSPSVVLLGADMVVIRPDPYLHGNGHAHQAIDRFPLSVEKVSMIKDCEVEGGWDEFMLPFIKYHSRWKGLQKNDFKYSCERSLFEDKGYNLLPTSKTKNANKPYNLEDIDRLEICPYNLHWLERIHALIQQRGSRLVLLSAPLQYRKEGLSRLASLHDWARLRKIDIIDLNLNFTETEINPATDFYDGGHLNLYGAEKATRFIGRWLTKNCTFGNIGSEAKEKWDLELMRYDAAKASAKQNAKRRASN